MNDILLRIREVFSDSGKSQTEIGKMISKTSQYVWKLLNDDSANPSDSVIKDICREFKVNENWLRYGTGDMFKRIPAEDETAAYVSELLEDEDNPLYCLIKSIMKTYSQLDTESQNVLKKFSTDMLHNMNAEKED